MSRKFKFFYRLKIQLEVEREKERAYHEGIKRLYLPRKGTNEQRAAICGS